MKSLNWLLYQAHRWVGVVLGLFMFFWFATGLVIMYSTPTTQNRSQQLAHAETLAPEFGWLSLGEAWDRSAEPRKAAAEHKAKTMAGTGKQPPGNGNIVTTDIADARLVRSAGEPLWLVEDSRGQYFALSALDGSVHKTSVDQALKIAEKWFENTDNTDIIKTSFLETTTNPVILRNQEALSPFHRIAVNKEGGELLISERTGEVLHASTLTGLIIGWLRWRPGLRGKPTYSQGRTQPYREFWFKWHFWSGLIGGIVILSWATSGFVDTNPGKIFSQANPGKEEIARYLGKGVPDAMRNWQPVLPAMLAIATDGADIVELGWRHLAGEAVLLAHTRDGQRLPQTLIDTAITQQFSETSLLAAVERVAGKTNVESQTVLNNYDSYYYPRHHQSLIEKPLPVLLVKMADDTGTLFYLDPQDGRLLAKLDQSRRIFRWLYSGLHHWDFGWLYQRPLWDAWMLIWVSFGLVLGASSLVVGWRRIKQTFFPKKKAVRAKKIETRKPVPTSPRYL